MSVFRSWFTIEILHGKPAAWFGCGMLRGTLIPLQMIIHPMTIIQYNAPHLLKKYTPPKCGPIRTPRDALRIRAYEGVQRDFLGK